MEYKDTLTMYNELIDTGLNKDIASAIVYQMNEIRIQIDRRIECLENRLMHKD